MNRFYAFVLCLVAGATILPGSFASAQAPSIVSISVPPGPYQAGSPIDVTLTTEGSFDTSNIFTVYISDSTGTFHHHLIAYTIGSYRGRTGRTIRMRLPCDAAGSGYRLRAIADEPDDTSSANDADLVIVPNVPIITAEGPTEFCEGESTALVAPPGSARYLWSNGEQGQRIVVRAAGFYYVTAIDSNGCSGTSAPFPVIVTPAPRPTITMSGATLRVEDIYTSYQWFHEGEAITGATTAMLPNISGGHYTVMVTSAGGCTGISDTFEAIITGVDEIEMASGTIAVTPHPVRDHAVVEIELTRGGTMEIVIRDVRGVVVRRIEEQAVPGRYRREISTTALPPGLYFLTAASGTQRWQRKLIRE